MNALRRTPPAEVDIVRNPARRRIKQVPAGKAIPLIIRGDFLDCANEAARPDNRSALGLMMQVCEGMIESFTHGKAPRDQVRELRFQFVSDVFGVRRKETKDINSSDTADDADDLI